MSYIDELRERFQAAEERFGRINEAGKEYRERLMGLMSRIEEEIRCRRDVERQQAQEIERLSDENEELRGMLMSLLQAVESGDPNSLDETLGDMDAKVASLIGEGQGAPAPSAETPAAAEDDGIFSAADMMADPADHASLEEEADDAPDGEGNLPENAFAAEDDPFAVQEDDSGVATEAAEPQSDADIEGAASDAAGSGASETVAASEIADFFDADSDGGEEMLPAYAHPAGEWDDFLNEDTPAAEALDDVAGSEDPEAGSIRDLMDRVKTEVEGDAGEQAADDDEKGGAAAAG